MEAALLSSAIGTAEEAKNVRRLVLGGVKLKSLVGIERFVALDELELRGTSVSNLDGIRGAPQLRHLTVWGGSVRSARPLGALSEPRTLRLPGVKLRSLDGLSDKPHLRHLDLGTTALSSLEPLTGLPALRVLALAGNKLRSLAGIDSFPLTHLDVARNPVGELEPLSAVPSLRWLNLADTRVRDLRPLGAATGLRFLALTGTQVGELAPVGALSELKELELGGIPIRDAAPLEGLALRGLLAWGTKLEPETRARLEQAAEERRRAADAHGQGLVELAVDLGLAADEEDAADVSHLVARQWLGRVRDLRVLVRMPSLVALGARPPHGARGGGHRIPHGRLFGAPRAAERPANVATNGRALSRAAGLAPRASFVRGGRV